MGTPVLPLSDIIDVVVQVSPQLPATPSFNQALIVGSSGVIPSSGANSRVRKYSTLSQMIADGFSISSPEYIASSILIGQAESPQYWWVGCQDETALNTVTPDLTSPGTGFEVGDIISPVQSGGNGGYVKVTSVNGSGGITGTQVISGMQGTGYSAQNVLAITGGHGTGAAVNIALVGETCLQAVEACRIASTAWYPVVALNAVKADNIAIGEWAQSQNPQCVYFYTSADADALAGTPGNVFNVLQAGSYNRAFGIYSTTQSGLAPNNIYAAVAAMGLAMGLNTGLANSFFTMKFKQLVGITAEPLNESQKATLEGMNANLYLGYANAYSWLEQGTVANGQFFDEIINLDMLAADYQYSIADLLISTPSVPQTEQGQSQILNTVDGCNQRAATRGFIASGTWTGVQILNLKTGQTVPNGYLSQSPAYSTQAPSARQQRQSMPVYVAIIEAGAIHSILIGVYVQR